MQNKLQRKTNCNAKETAMQKKLQRKNNCNAKEIATQKKLQCKKKPFRVVVTPRSSHHHLPEPPPWTSPEPPLNLNLWT
jgi:hypothetical protein